MNRDQIQTSFFELIKPYIRIPDPVITEASLLVDDLKVNSTRFVDIILEAEDKFNITVRDEDMERFDRVGDAIDFIFEKTSLAA